jgi:phage terminase large subunit-like protein
MRWMVGNVAIRMDSNGNFKPDKEKSSEKIDGVVAVVRRWAWPSPTRTPHRSMRSAD